MTGAVAYEAVVHEFRPPRGPRRKRKGGGGDHYDEAVAEVWRDRRATPESRELLLLVLWVISRDPDRFVDVGNAEPWTDRAIRVLGDDPGALTAREAPRFARLVVADAPRYEVEHVAWGEMACQGPMARRPTCGKHGTDYIFRFDRETGWATKVWFCSRHSDWGGAQREAERVVKRVEPIPNRGGLLPCYLSWPDDAWARLYRWALQWRPSCPAWKPPSYGLRADGWRLPWRPEVPEGCESPEDRRARFRVVVS